jgi:DNA-binding MarR family transcriptional regulator
LKEIIKRLVKNGLFEESPDKDDKRSTRISVTKKGKKVFQDSMKDITIVSKIMCGKLDNEEKQNLLDSLKKLNTFHHTIYSNFKNEETKEIVKMISND